MKKYGSGAANNCAIRRGQLGGKWASQEELGDPETSGKGGKGRGGKTRKDKA